MADAFSGTLDSVSGPATRAAAVAPHDANPLADIPKALFVGTGGNVMLRGAGAGRTCCSRMCRMEACFRCGRSMCARRARARPTSWRYIEMLDLGLRQRGSFSPRSLFARGEAGAWYDPSDLAGMAQNSDGTGAAAVGSPVGRINDKSGRGNHAVQAVAAARPILRLESGFHYLEFDGVDDNLKALFAFASRPVDRVSALRQISWTASDYIFGGGAADLIGLYQTGGSPNFVTYDGASGPASAGAATGANAVLTERFNGASSRIAVNSAAYTIGNAGAGGNAGGITLGSFHGGSFFSNIRLYGVCMIGRALSDAETAQLRRFMAARAGVAL